MLLKVFRRNEKKMSDEDLLAGYLAGEDPELLAELFSRYMHMVYGVCLKYLRNREDSKDCVIRIWEKVTNELVRHRPENFRAWLYVVTKNFCLMEIRASASERRHHDEWASDQLVFMESEQVMHPVDRDEGDTDQALKDCIGQLSDLQKRSVELFYFSNKCYREIADELQTDEKRVKSLLQNGKRNIKICLEGKNVKYG